MSELSGHGDGSDASAQEQLELQRQAEQEQAAREQLEAQERQAEAEAAAPPPEVESEDDAADEAPPGVVEEPEAETEAEDQTPPDEVELDDASESGATIYTRTERDDGAEAPARAKVEDEDRTAENDGHAEDDDTQAGDDDEEEKDRRGDRPDDRQGRTGEDEEDEDGDGGEQPGDRDEDEEDDGGDGEKDGDRDGGEQPGDRGRDGDDDTGDGTTEGGDGSDIASKVDAVLAAEEQLIERETRAEELANQYNEAISQEGTTDEELEAIASAMDDAERDVISSFRTTENLYESIRDLTLEQRLEAIGRSDLAPEGVPITTIDGTPIDNICNFYDYRLAASGSGPIGPNSVTDLRGHLLNDLGKDLANAGYNTAMAEAELVSNHADNAYDSDNRFFTVTQDPVSGHLIANYYCFAPVKESTFRGFEHYLDPRNYDVEKTLREGRPRNPERPTAAYGVPESTGRGLAIIVTHTLNERPRLVERMGHGAHVRFDINPDLITTPEIQRVLAEARGETPPAQTTAQEESEEDILGRFGDDL